jgi:hypothetical protein
MNLIAKIAELCGIQAPGRRRRSRIWSSVAASTHAIQQLETRCLMSASMGTERSGDAWSFQPENADGALALGGGTNPSVDGGTGGETGPISCFADYPGGGDFGTGDGGGSGTADGSAEVSLTAVDDEMLEGPYEKTRLDEAVLRLTRTGTASGPLDVRIDLTGKAEPWTDYRVADMQRDSLEPGPVDGTTKYCLVTIPAGQTSVDFKLISMMDRHFEADEDVKLEVVPHRSNNYSPGESATAKVNLVDETADIDLAFEAHNQELMDDEFEDKSGSFIPLNSDFDFERDMPDHEWLSQHEDGMTIAEDDTVRMLVTSRIRPNHDYAGLQTRMHFELDFDPSSVRIYRYNRGSANQRPSWQRVFVGNHFELDYQQQLELVVEGTKADRDRVSLIWKSNAIVERHLFDAASYTVWDVDLDIDSNNVSDLLPPERTRWQEQLEESKYGIGKLVYPPPAPGAPEDPTVPPQGNGLKWTPVVFSTGPVLAGETGLSFRHPELRGESGAIRLWRKTGDSLSELKERPIEDGGDLITPGRIYSRDELGGSNQVYIEALLAQRRHDDLQGANRGCPSDELKLRVYHRSDSGEFWRFAMEDSVKYLVTTDRDRFYPNLQFHRSGRYWGSSVAHTGIVLRDSLISEGVYGYKDLPQFGQQLLDREMMLRLGLSVDAVNKIITGRITESGFKCSIYRDFLSTDGLDYVLAFGGTDMELSDIVNDVLQGLGLSGSDWIKGKTFEDQYVEAMSVAGHFGTMLDATGRRGRTTGHSLGGGLASAASVVCEKYPLPAHTFNAAGLHINTITQRYDGVLQPDLPWSPNAFNRYWTEKAMEGRIVAFSTEYDPLTFVQEHLGPLAFVGRIPQAIGTAVRLQSPFDTFVHNNRHLIAETIRVVPDTGWLKSYKVYVAKLTFWIKDVIKEHHLPLGKMLPHHGIRAVHYGLMVHTPSMQRRRLFDIFGDKDPGE